MITILFTQKDSVYNTIPNTDTWDKTRNAINYQGKEPIIAHPPCRAWGDYAHKAKPEPGEKELTRWTVKKIREVGGVMEHPRRSKIWKELPRPGKPDHYGGFTINIDQYWFGHQAIKNTTLYIVGTTPRNIPPIPIKLPYKVRSVENMSKRQRESTPPELAKWLIKLIEIIKKNKTEQNSHEIKKYI